MTAHDTAKKRPFDTYRVRVEKTELISPRVKNIVFKYEQGHAMTFTAGQFVQIFIPLPDGTTRRTSYSIASAPQMTDGFELCVTLIEGGKSSTFLHNLKVGDEVQSLGPLGKFVLPEPPPRDLVFIATGSGVAPFRSMINDLASRGTDRRLDLVFGNRFEEDILYRPEWENLARSFPRFRHLFTLSRPSSLWPGAHGFVQSQIPSHIKNPPAHDFYICGLVKMIDDVTATLKGLGVPPEQIHFERYD